MIDLRKTVIAKSDQLNADDLIGQTKTVKVTKVSLLTEADQPVALSFEDDGNKPYKPCKSMRRVLVNIWGPDGNAYIGRSMTLYRDEKVMFGGVATGGIRISHMSHIDGPVTMALSVTRANRKPFTVQPLATPAPTRAQNGVPADVLAVRELGGKAADAGMDALRHFWDGLSKSGKAAVGGTAQLAAWKTIAEAADAPDIDFDKPPLGDRFYREPDPVVTSGMQQMPATGAATEPAGGVPPEPAEATSQGPLEGAAVYPPGAAAPSDPMAGDKAWAAEMGAQIPSSAAANPHPHPAETDRATRRAEIRKDGAARAASGTAALTNYLEDLRKSGESDLVSPTQASAWHETAKAADAKAARK